MTFITKIASYDGSKKKVFKCMTKSFLQFKSIGCEKLGLCPEDIRIVTDEDFEVDDLDTVHDMCQSTVFYFLQPEEKLITLNTPTVAMSDISEDKTISTSATAKDVASNNGSLGYKICAPTMPNPDLIKEETVDDADNFNFPEDSSPSNSRGLFLTVKILLFLILTMRKDCFFYVVIFFVDICIMSMRIEEVESAQKAKHSKKGRGN